MTRTDILDEIICRVRTGCCTLIGRDRSRLCSEWLDYDVAGCLELCTKRAGLSNTSDMIPDFELTSVD